MQIDDFDVKSFPVVDTIGLSSGNNSLKVCIVTEEIIGPVRNGGIASTYYHLSKGLAAHGHEVHVLFLKGRVVQDETPEHWIDHFAEFGVTLHYLELPEDPAWGAAIEWQARFKAAYDWLRDRDAFDVVHTSEWRGGLTYALMAKRLGLAFPETLFLVKTSSPHIWNRHYQMQPIERRELVLAAYAEQKCVELADAVIGGSAHLITFMGEIGYRVPDQNVFVQPNIVDFSKVIVTDERPPRHPGDIVKTKELIFFGRLEGRKGVELMCNALDILIERGELPEKVSFMGKWGAPLATQNGMKVEDYIEAKSKDWPFPVTLITDKNQPAALSHMCSRDMIAVMPSLIENSTMAVYETLENNIPFIATAVGGTPELIVPEDHAACLVAPKSTALADRLEAVLKEGQVIAHSSFSNERNLESWYGFHAFVGDKIAQMGRPAAIAEIAGVMDTPGTPVNSVGFCVLARRRDDLEPLVEALKAAPPDQVVLAFNDTSMRKQARDAKSALEAEGINAHLVDCIGQAAGDTLNMLAQTCETDALVIAHGAGMAPRPGFFDAARKGLTHRPDALFTTFFEAANGVLGMPIGGDIASQFLSSRAYGPEMIALRRERYEALGPFETYDVRCGIIHAYVTHAVETGPDDLLVYPEVLVDWPEALDDARGFAEDSVYSYLKAKPLIDRSSIAQRKITLASLHQNGQGGGGSISDNQLRDGGRTKEENLWLMPVEWDREDLRKAAKRALVVALDESRSQLMLYARGPGTRALKINHVTQNIHSEETWEEDDPENMVTLARFDIPEAWEAGTSYPISWGLYEGETQTKNQFLRINKIGRNSFVLTARNPILSKAALDGLIAIQQTAALQKHSLDTQNQTPEAMQVDELSEFAESPAEVLSDTSDPADVAAALDEPTPKPAAKKSLEDLSGDLAGLGLKTDAGSLLALFRTTGRKDLERQSLSLRSEELLSDLDAIASSGTGDIRSFLSSPAKPGHWGANGWLKGWAWDRKDHDRFLHVAVVRDGTPLFIVRADVEVPSLGRRTPGLQSHGFRIPVLAEFLESSGGPISLEIWESGDVVRSGELKVIDDGAPLLQQIKKAAG